MAEAYDFETRDRAGDAYIKGGMTYEQISAEMGISRNTLIGWGQRYEWKKKREEFRASVMEEKAESEKIRKLRKDMIAKACDSLDPQNIYAVVRLEKLIQEIDRKKAQDEDSKAPDIDRPRIFLEDVEFIAGVLKEIDPEGLKVLSRSIDTIIERFKEAHP